VYAPHSCHTLQAARLVVGLNWFLLLLHMMSIVGGVGPRSFVLTIFLVRAAVVVVVAVLPFFEVAFNSLSFLFCPFFVSFISFFFSCQTFEERKRRRWVVWSRCEEKNFSVQ